MMLTDSHIHTFLCKHATGEIAEYIEAANKNGITEICFTDHVPAPDGYDSKHRMDMDKYPFYHDTIKELRKNSRNPYVLFGVEADYYQDCEKILYPWLSEQDFDLVIGSIHYIRDWGFDNPEERSIWDSVDIPNTWREYLELLGKLANTRLYDVIGHLDIPKKFGHKPTDKILKELAKPALDRIASANMAIELNTAGLRKTIGEIYPSLLILQMAHERKIPICFGSDAHQPGEVGYAFDEALQLAREAGYTQYVRFSHRKKQLTPLP
ncbi:MAG: histidinol-phosphatase HisJ family protein [Kiritimatiellae bacterium]|nr:histidinol-phosphatase HisJ family protein [Kiritimatiellia bacterium]MDD5522301.1 histidinol-phosphatase HisJ family protein [Kiritimatiellia bacterium]